MYSQYAAEYVQAENSYRAETVRRSAKPSRRRARALEESELRSMKRQQGRRR